MSKKVTGIDNQKSGNVASFMEKLLNVNFAFTEIPDYLGIY